MINFDDIWQKYSNVSRIEFACFSFYVGLLFINFSSFKPDTTKMTQQLTESHSMHALFSECSLRDDFSW